MYFLSGVTDQTPQPVLIPISGQNDAALTLYFRPTQNMWFFDLSWNDFATQGQSVVNNPNLLTPWENILPFGLGCSTQDGQDPYGLEAFANGNAQLFLLTADDLTILNETLYPGL